MGSRRNLEEESPCAPFFCRQVVLNDILRGLVFRPTTHTTLICSLNMWMCVCGPRLFFFFFFFSSENEKGILFGPMLEKNPIHSLMFCTETTLVSGFANLCNLARFMICQSF